MNAHGHEHRHEDGTVHAHAQDGEYTHQQAETVGDGHPLIDGTGQRYIHVRGGPYAPGTIGAAHAPGLPSARMIQIEQDILAKNNAFAAENRRFLVDHGVFALNLVSSPGSGKTTLLVRTIETLNGRAPVAVIEGDQQTSRDADRIRATGAKAVQINTGRGCHLDAQMVGQALQALDLAASSLLMIENVGNLVCPAAFDLGEAHKVVILSVTEGEDKPLKYPDMFHVADLLLINKVDLLPYVQFDVDAAVEYARRVRPGLTVMRVSATTGEGLEAWLTWLEQGVTAAKAERNRNVEALRRRVAALEAELAQQTATTAGDR